MKIQRGLPFLVFNDRFVLILHGKIAYLKLHRPVFKPLQWSMQFQVEPLEYKHWASLSSPRMVSTHLVIGSILEL